MDTALVFATTSCTKASSPLVLTLSWVSFCDNIDIGNEGKDEGGDADNGDFRTHKITEDDSTIPISSTSTAFLTATASFVTTTSKTWASSLPSVVPSWVSLFCGVRWSAQTVVVDASVTVIPCVAASLLDISDKGEDKGEDSDDDGDSGADTSNGTIPIFSTAATSWTATSTPMTGASL